MKPLKICLTASELAPLAKTGGLADVCSALATYLHDNGHDVRVLLPLYSSIDLSEVGLKPVSFMQDMSTDFAGRRIGFSIYTGHLPGTRTPVYLLRCDELYRRNGIYPEDGDEHLRFLMLCRGAIAMCQHMGWPPDIFHCNDWHTAMVPVLVKNLFGWDGLFANTKSVLTIHNIGFQGVFGSGILGETGMAGCADRLHQDDLNEGRINFLKNGILYADHLTTVSPTYAREIQTADFAFGLEHMLQWRNDHLTGILNGVDYQEWDPANDKLIPFRFSRDDLAGKAKNKRALLKELSLQDTGVLPLFGVVSRLTSQKGVELIEQVMPQFLAQGRCQLAVLGSGESRYERFFTALQQRFPGRMCYYRGFSNKLAHWIEAGSDMFLMPSLFEPCGLNQMYSLRYGTIPIVRATGGLADSVQQFNAGDGTGTGIVFRDYNSDGLRWAVGRGLELFDDAANWRTLMDNAMRQDFSWDKQGAKYVELYSQLATGH